LRAPKPLIVAASVVCLALAILIASFTGVIRSAGVAGYIVSGAGYDYLGSYVAMDGYILSLPSGAKTVINASINGVSRALEYYWFSQLPNGSVAVVGYEPSSYAWILAILGSGTGIELGVAPHTAQNYSAMNMFAPCGGGICVLSVVNTSAGFRLSLINVSTGLSEEDLLLCSEGISVSVPSYSGGALYAAVYCGNASSRIYGLLRVSGSSVEIYNMSMPSSVSVSRLSSWYYIGAYSGAQVPFLPFAVYVASSGIFIPGVYQQQFVIISLGSSSDTMYVLGSAGSAQLYNVGMPAAVLGTIRVPAVFKNSSGSYLGEVDFDTSSGSAVAYLYPFFEAGHG